MRLNKDERRLIAYGDDVSHRLHRLTQIDSSAANVCHGGTEAQMDRLLRILNTSRRD